MADEIRINGLRHQLTSSAITGLTTYFATGTAYGGYATPTDMLTISGSATKVIRIVNMQMRIGSTAGALYRLYFIRRTAPNTGGTFAAQTPVSLDTVSAAPTAVVNLYSVIPDALGAGETIGIAPSVTTVLTAAPNIFSLIGAGILQPSAITTTEALTLRGASQFLCANGNGAAIPAGFTAQWEIIWTESDQ